MNLKKMIMRQNLRRLWCLKIMNQIMIICTYVWPSETIRISNAIYYVLPLLCLTVIQIPVTRLTKVWYSTIQGPGLQAISSSQAELTNSLASYARPYIPPHAITAASSRMQLVDAKLFESFDADRFLNHTDYPIDASITGNRFSMIIESCKLYTCICTYLFNFIY